MNAPVRFDVPADLRKLRQWLVWRYEKRAGDDKPTKVPYVAGAQSAKASTIDPTTWRPFEQAVQVFERGRAHGIGFVFSETDAFCGIDLDGGCRNPETGELSAKAKAIVEELDSYTESSPSGRGVHIIVRAKLHGSRNRRGPVEIYDRRRFFAMTGEHLPGAPWSPMPRQRELDALVARLFPPSVEPPRNGRPVVVRDDREVLERAFAARNGMDFRRLWNGDWSGYGSHSEADLALVSHLAYWTDGNADQVDRLFRHSGLYRTKWERADYRARTIAKALNDG